MTLLVDVGNTTTNLGLVADGDLVDTWETNSDLKRTNDELWHQWRSMIGTSFADDVRLAVASVVPEISRTIRTLEERSSVRSVRFLSPPWKHTNVSVRTDHPEEVGGDRVAGAEAMIELFDHGIVVDFGTATTVDYIDQSGAYRGGVILPGLRAAARGLSQETALLPSISPEGSVDFTFSNTRQAVETGLVHGMIGSVNEVVHQFRERGMPSGAPVVATGGAADLFVDKMSTLTDHCPGLVLRGLRMISDRWGD